MILSCLLYKATKGIRVFYILTHHFLKKETYDYYIKFMPLSLQNGLLVLQLLWSTLLFKHWSFTDVLSHPIILMVEHGRTIKTYRLLLKKTYKLT